MPRFHAASAAVLMLLAAAGVLAVPAPYPLQIVSRTAGGEEAVTGAAANSPSLSADGRYTAFLSNARNYASVRPGIVNVFVKDALTGQVELISRSAGGDPANADSYRCLLSADARYVAFLSRASNLVPNDSNGVLDVFVYDRTTGTVERANVNSAEEQASGGFECSGCDDLAMSPDGRYVAFHSGHTNLAPDDTNGESDMFVRDRALGITERVSVSSAGEQANSSSGHFGFSISADGRYVAFPSDASNLVPDDQNGVADVFVRDRTLQTTERVTTTPEGAEATGITYNASVSGDGRYVAFQSSARNLVPGAEKYSDGIYVRDRQQNTLIRVDVGLQGGYANQQSHAPLLSLDGRFVLFTSYGSNLVEGDTNQCGDLFIRDLVAGATERVSVATGGGQGSEESGWDHFSVSPDGRYVAFPSTADNLAAGDTNGRRDVLLRDRTAGTTRRLSEGNPDQGVAGALSTQAVVSRGGRYVAFVSDADNLVPGDTNRASDVFVRDMETGAVERVSVSTGGAEGNAGSSRNTYSVADYIRPAITPDGRYVAFLSHATNLVPGDTNLREDYFVRDRQLGTTERVNLSDSGEQALLGYQSSSPPAITPDGRYVAFEGSAPNLDPGFPQIGGIFVRDRRLGRTERVNFGYRNVRPTGGSATNPSISDDGRYVAFESNAPAFFPGDTDPFPDVYVRDRHTRTTERLTFAHDGGALLGTYSFGAQISADGRYVAFVSYIQNLVPGDTNFRGDVFVRDRRLGKTERESVGANGAQAPTGAMAPALSADGRLVAFVSDSNGLVPGDGNNATDVFVRDRLTGNLVRASAASDGEEGNFGSDFLFDTFPALSSEGRFVVFNTPAGLDAMDIGGTSDVYRRDLGVPVPAAPRNLRARVHGSEIQLTWQLPSTDETSVVVERKSSSEEYSELAQLSAGTTSFTDGEAEPGVLYTYRVFAVNERGRSLPTNAASAGIKTVPAGPEGLQAVAQGRGVNLTWVDRSDLEVGFSLERSVGTGSFTVLRALPRNTTSYRDVRVRPGILYTYRVRATHRLGSSPYSNTASATPTP